MKAAPPLVIFASLWLGQIAQVCLLKAAGGKAVFFASRKSP